MKARTADVAKGKWRGILLAHGANADWLNGKHGPCPFCGGRDRFRWDNKNGNGSFICAGCGAGDGFQFLCKLNGWTFKEAAAAVDGVVGNVGAETIRQAMSEEDRRAMLNRVWRSGSPVVAGDPVERYLTGRGVKLPQNIACLRYVERCPVPASSPLPAMVAMIASVDGQPVNMHRTFLGPNGKADMPDPRATMPGSLPEGSAVHLSMHGERLGIAEGIETALAASARFNMPVWAAVNATMLAKWIAPETVTEVVVFGDNDPKFGGAAAAYALAHRLAKAGKAVEVKIPTRVGCDWADADAA